MGPGVTDADPGDLATRFFDELARSGLTSIQFKSTRTLANAFAGLEDFDLLIPPSQFTPILQIAEGLGFRLRRTTDPFHPAPIVDLLGWDPTVSRLHHLSLHRTLVFGERPIKRHAIPWATLAAVTTVVHRPGLHVLPAAAELALLIARILLRCSRPERLRRPWRRVMVPVDGRMHAELLALSSDVSDEALRSAAALLMPGSEELVVGARRRFVNGSGASGDTASDAVRTEEDRRALVRALRPLATRSRPGSWIRMLRHARTRTVRDLGRGAVVAVVGADGAGKSTVTRAVVELLGTKLTVRSVYLGLPRDAPAIARLGLLAAVAGRLRLAGPARWLDRARPVVVARTRRRILARARADARRGIVSVADRYPLEEFHAVEPPMDGPRLTGAGWLARLERRTYAAMPRRPDVLVALVAEPAVLTARKPGDEDPAIVAAKADAVRALASTRPDVIAIDATLPLDTVVSRVVSAVWDRLVAQPS